MIGETPQYPRLPHRLAFIGTAGIPNRYGGFEAFLEHCAPEIAKSAETEVTCDAHLYPNAPAEFQGVRRSFIPVRANGGASIVHDLLAFLRVYPRSTHIIVLGVSGGIWFPLFRLLCSLSGKKLLVNIDGVEWRRTKFSRTRRAVLRTFDALAQWSAHRIVYDNAGLRPFVLPSCLSKASEIAYPGDHVRRLPGQVQESNTALTICRIEPENNIDMLIQGALKSGIRHYTIVGNWDNSDYGRQLRAQYAGNQRLSLCQPIYDTDELARLRERCELYIHGHSVGGTNPSLVEMLYYDCTIVCFDCSFNRITADTEADYFSDADELAQLIDRGPRAPGNRTAARARFTRQKIASQYLELVEAVVSPQSAARSLRS